MEKIKMEMKQGINWLYIVSKTELKTMKARNLQRGDIVRVGKYIIYVQYGPWEDPNKYDIPLCTYVETEDGKTLDCFPGTSRGFTPYFIDRFKSA